MYLSVSFTNRPKITFDGHYKSNDLRWVSFEISEGENGQRLNLTIWDPPDHLVQYLYGCNAPKVDEVRTPANGITKFKAEEAAMKQLYEGEKLAGLLEERE